MFFKLSRFLIVGISKSGFSACNALLSLGADCTVFDNSTSTTTYDLIGKLKEKGAKTATNEDVNTKIGDCDIIVLSPGVPIDSEIPVLARRLHKRVIGELELGSMIIKNPVVAITGTNGKTTSCCLLNHILSMAKIDSFLAGNIGEPLCSKINTNANEIAITEVSSYQLETVSSFTPHIACILNISPDHLSRHYNMENYIYLKGRILKNMRESEYAVLNYDDKIVKSFSENSRTNVVFFSMLQKVNGAYLQNEKLYFNDEFIMDADRTGIKGGHNIQNCLAVICICKLLHLTNDQIAKGIETFCGVKHRQQLIATKGGIRFINDSKSTNPSSTLSAISECSENTILLAGGKDKGEGYNELFEKIANEKKIENVIIFGSSAQKLYNIANDKKIKNISVFRTFEQAVNYSVFIAKKGDTVLLSPACASFDEFTCFEERGDKFIEIIQNLKNDEE